MRSMLVVSALATLAAAGCKKTQGVDQADPGQVRVSTDVVVRTSPVGEGEFERRATYVLVDAENASKGDLDITLGGVLVDAAGATVGTLRPESLRIPGGAKRTFALVDDRDRDVASATTARIEVLGSSRPRWRPTVTLADGHRFDDHGKVMVAARVTNDADRPGKVVVLAAFHDADGRPVARPFDVVPLAAGASKVVRFVGPAGATTGTIFLGDASY